MAKSSRGKGRGCPKAYRVSVLSCENVAASPHGSWTNKVAECFDGGSHQNVEYREDYTTRPDDARTSMDMAGALDFYMNKVWFQICSNPLPENL